jgi:NADH-quinone oxidoreductase subunit L
VLSLLAIVGGWLQVAGVWHPFSDWLDPVAFGYGEAREHLALVEPSVTQDYVTSALAVSLGLAGIWLAWIFYGARSRAVPRSPFAQETLEHKLWFDELYDWIFFRPAVLLTRGLRRGVEEPLIGGSITGVSASAREAGGAVGEAQTGYLRTYALAIAAGVAVLVVVFVSVQ